MVAWLWQIAYNDSSSDIDHDCKMSVMDLFCKFAMLVWYCYVDKRYPSLALLCWREEGLKRKHACSFCSTEAEARWLEEGTRARALLRRWRFGLKHNCCFMRAPALSGFQRFLVTKHFPCHFSSVLFENPERANVRGEFRHVSTEWFLSDLLTQAAHSDKCDLGCRHRDLHRVTLSTPKLCSRNPNRPKWRKTIG